MSWVSGESASTGFARPRACRPECRAQCRFARWRRWNTGLLRHALVHQLLDGFDETRCTAPSDRGGGVQQVNGVHAERQCALLAAPNQVLGRPSIPRGAAVGEDCGSGPPWWPPAPRPSAFRSRASRTSFSGLFFAAGAVVGPSGVDVTAAGVQRGMQVSMPTSWPRLFSMVSGISPWPMAVVENGPRLRNNAMVIPFNSNETVCVRFQRKQNAGFTAHRTSRHPNRRTSHRNRSRHPSRSWRIATESADGAPR